MWCLSPPSEGLYRVQQQRSCHGESTFFALTCSLYIIFLSLILFLLLKLYRRSPPWLALQPKNEAVHWGTVSNAYIGGAFNQYTALLYFCAKRCNSEMRRGHAGLQLYTKDACQRTSFRSRFFVVAGYIYGRSEAPAGGSVIP